MFMMKKQTALSLAGATAILLLAGCGGNGGSSTGNSSSTTTTTTNDPKVATGGWDATDACALLDKATLGAALKDQVTETSLGLVHQASGGEAATSECNYLLASGGRVSFMARNSPIADNTDGAIAAARKATQQSVSAFTDKKVEDVPGLGKAAFFVPGINQLNVFIDDSKFVILTIGSAPDATAKETAVALVRDIKK
jgi:ABC-type glycerol-3-phosphate transport system substrate-binding protein